MLDKKHDSPQYNGKIFEVKKELDLTFSNLSSCGEGNGTPLQYSCWKIPWAEEPGGLQSMGSRRVRHD